MPITFADPSDLDLDPFHERLEELSSDNPAEHFVHADGSHTFIVYDDDSEHANPRHNDGNLATLVQVNTRSIEIDDDDEGLSEVREHFYSYGPSHGGPRAGKRAGYTRETMVRRYLAIFRPEILFYTDYWAAGDSYGFGYVTTADWTKAMGEDYTGDVTPEKALDQEVDIYRQWADGEVYGGIHVTKGEPVVVLGEEGAYVDGYRADEDSCWGFLGYDDLADITEQFTDSPVVEVLA